MKGKSIQIEEWETVVSKKTIKMLKQHEEDLSVKWKSTLESILNLKAVSRSYVSTSTIVVQKHSNIANLPQHEKQLAQISSNSPIKPIKSNKVERKKKS